MPIVIALILLLSACASPAPGYFGATRHDITLDGIRFAVFTKGPEAEVIRLGYLTRKDRARVPGLMERAAEQASGCRAVTGSLVTRIPGDTGEGVVTLDCQDRKGST